MKAYEAILVPDQNTILYKLFLEAGKNVFLGAVQYPPLVLIAKNTILGRT